MKSIDRVRRGEVIVVRQCLQAIAYFDQLQEASLEGIRQVVGDQKAARVREEGFESIHTIIDVEELDSVVNSTYEVFRALAPVLSKRLVQNIFQTEKPFYFEEYPNLRFHIPYDVRSTESGFLVQKMVRFYATNTLGKR